MEVPFDKLGPGQSGRLVYQVLGRNGPIFNPQNIRYLDPTQAQQFAGPDVPSFGIDAGLALSGVNLMASVGTLAMTAVVLSEVRRLHERLDFIGKDLASIKTSIKEILAIVKRIDLKTTETNFREAFNHVSRKAVQGNEIVLSEFVSLIDELEQFEQALDSPLLFNFGFRVSADLRDKLYALWDFLVKLRCQSVREFNAGCAPGSDVMVNPLFDYVPGILRVPAEALQYKITIDSFSEYHASVMSTMAESFTFFDEDDAKKFAALAEAQFDRFGTIFGVYSSDATAFMNNLYAALPKAKLDQLCDDTDDGAHSRLWDMAVGWLASSDGGLVLRLKQELIGLRNGYAQSFLMMSNGGESAEGPATTKTYAVQVGDAGAFRGAA